MHYLAAFAVCCNFGSIWSCLVPALVAEDLTVLCFSCDFSSFVFFVCNMFLLCPVHTFMHIDLTLLHFCCNLISLMMAPSVVSFWHGCAGL